MTESHLASTPTNLADKRQALILIAEDEPEIADILSAYLKHSGFQTAHAPDGRRALELHQSLKSDLVLLDVLMPNLDGWMVLAEIRHRGTTPVIMLTAQDQDMDKLMGLRIGTATLSCSTHRGVVSLSRAAKGFQRTANGCKSTK